MNKPILDKSIAITRGPLPGSRKLMIDGVPFREVPLSGGGFQTQILKARFKVLPKVRLARNEVRAGHLRLFIEVDGGIDADTIGAAAEAGADVFVAGSAVYGADDPGKAVDALRVTARDAMRRA